MNCKIQGLFGCLRGSACRREAAACKVGKGKLRGKETPTKYLEPQDECRKGRTVQVEMGLFEKALVSSLAVFLTSPFYIFQKKKLRSALRHLREEKRESFLML